MVDAPWAPKTVCRRGIDPWTKMGNNGLIVVEQTILATRSAPKVQILPAQGPESAEAYRFRILTIDHVV
jgi:hypothetical protein